MIFLWFQFDSVNYFHCKEDVENLWSNIFDNFFHLKMYVKKKWPLAHFFPQALKKVWLEINGKKVGSLKLLM